MIKLKKMIPVTDSAPMTDAACAEIKDRFDVSDERGHFSLFNAIWPQFSAHQAWDTQNLDGVGLVNIYNGFDDGQGVYGPRRQSPLKLKDGRFRLSDKGLPYIADTNIELVSDEHRGNEHMALKALHLMAVMIHNKRMDVNEDYEASKRETVALLNRISLNEGVAFTGIEERSFLNDVVVRGLNHAVEWPMAIGRWAHAMMPDTIAGRSIFERGISADVDVPGLLTEKARDFSLGTSTAMREMTHLPSEPFDILQRTFARHADHKLASFQDLQEVYGEPRTNRIPEGTPIWPGMLLESLHGRPGPTTARAVADGIAGSLLWGEGKAEGLWFPMWSGAPRSTEDIVDYAYG